MSKSLTGLWLRGLKRLAKQSQRQSAAGIKRRTKAALAGAAPAARRAQPATAALPKTGGKNRLAPPKPKTRVSAPRPVPVAVPAGRWTRSFHSAPPAPGDLVSHLGYGLYLPSGHAEQGLPLVVMLHGCKQQAKEFAQGTRMNLLADQAGFAVAYPEQSNHAHAQRCWRWYDPSPGAGGAEAAAIVSLVGELVERHGFDASRVYVAGMSAGAGMATLLAARYPHVFAAVGVHSGMVFGDAHSAITGMHIMRRGSRRDPLELVAAAVDVARFPCMPAILLHGNDDFMVSPVNAAQLEAQFLRLNGLSDAHGKLHKGVVRKDRADGFVMRDYLRHGRLFLRVCQVPGLSHAWSGGDAAVPFHAATGPVASAMFWGFFRDQRRTAEVLTEEDGAGGATPQPAVLGAPY